MTSASEQPLVMRKRRTDDLDPVHRLARRIGSEVQHVRRQEAHDVLPQDPHLDGGLASGRGDALPTTAAPSATNGGLASDRGNGHIVSTSTPQNHDAPSTSAPAPDAGSHPDPTTAHPPASQNGNNGNQDDHPATIQPVQHTPTEQQQPSHPPTTSAHSTPPQQQHDGNEGRTRQSSSQDHDAGQQTQISPPAGNHDVTSQAPTATSSAHDTSIVSSDAALASALPASSAVSGINDNATGAGNEDIIANASSSDSKSSKLSAGGTAGIVIAILGLLVLVAGIVLYRNRRRKERAISWRKSGNVRIMSEHFSGASSFYGMPNASTASGGFITFQDNASTRTHDPTLPGSPSGGSMTYHAPAPAPSAAHLQLRQERPEDDDVSNYDHETVDTHGDMSQPSAAYYNTATIVSREARHPRTPEYNLPTPPIPAFDGEEAVLASRTSTKTMTYLTGSQAGYRRTHEDRRPLSRSISSQNSYVDEQLRDLYVDHY